MCESIANFAIIKFYFLLIFNNGKIVKIVCIEVIIKNGCDWLVGDPLFY